MDCHFFGLSLQKQGHGFGNDMLAIENPIDAQPLTRQRQMVTPWLDVKVERERLSLTEHAAARQYQGEPLGQY